MRGYLYLLPVFLALGATAGIWIVFGIAVVHKKVNVSEVFPYISVCGGEPPPSCVFSQVLNLGAAAAAWICILRYHQLRDWGVRKWPNYVILGSGLLCALGTSIVGNFQHQHLLAVHLTGAFLAFFVGTAYFWLQLAVLWRWRNPPQPGGPWIRLLRLGLCSSCTILMVAMVVLHTQSVRWRSADGPPDALHARDLRSAAAVCEWTLAMGLFTLFGLLAVDFWDLDGCSLCLQKKEGPHLSSPPASPVPLQTQLSQQL
ncbi:modulator of macroautophagy TMEM150B [Erinaceus europaeus]|uniref:Modulator of macroautophagy TMEM150B n=1 Tax=Erinaceus europaeus TaxID=9365 RepID=A0A1S3AHT4_ERIEU|nr:modulator of macroautophagy TMEM150B [Erinaceus europaeus]